MTRLGMVPELTFAEDFKQLRRDIEAIKGAQRVGRDILKPKIIEALDGSGNPTLYDIEAEAVYDPDFGGYNVRADFAARFQADHQLEPWATPLYKLMYGDPNTPATAGQTFGFSYPWVDDFYDEPGRVTYHGWFGNNNFGDSTSVFIKVYFYATDTGTLTVTEEPYV